MNTSNNNIIEFIKDKLGELKEFIYKHLRIVLPIAVAVVALIVLIISLSAHNAKKAREAAEEAAALAEEEQQSQLNVESAVLSVPEVALEEDAYPAVNELMKKYFIAKASGDIDIVRSYNNNVDDTEAIRIEETAKYIESYENIKVYTKIGPAPGTYVAYVYYEEKFRDYDDSIPGLEAFYVCTDESGNLYINDGEESESVINYIREASLQDDVVDLNNEVASAYNNMLAENESLSLFLVDLTESIDTAVGESLAQSEVGTDTQTAEEETEEEPEEEEAEPTNTVTEVKTVRATTTVNIRSSDSETADKLGKANEGQEFTLIEERGNGWSEISYNNSSAFIKSEYLEEVSTETVVTVNNGNDADTTDNNTQTETASAANVSGTVTVKDNVRIRATASTEGEKVGTAYMGQKLDFIEKLANGWTKIRYNGQIAYVKSDYVE
ncbi:SH3 domain-containing protein [Lachnospiraceae bacterium XBB2008]|nr:SH3 domain-containing protein [Lachnospiraceae bacterium XBB2008]